MTGALLEASEVSVDYVVRASGRKHVMRAVDCVDLTVSHSEIVGLVGESGCGKSTLARAIVGLERPSEGRLLLGGEALPARRARDVRKRIQMVFQDPGSSLDPRQTVEQALVTALRVHKLVPRSEESRRVRELLQRVELPAKLASARSGALSGGQKQRVAIARALAVEPDVIVADEAVAALDASATGAVLNLLSDLRDQLGLTVLFISHDLSVVRGLCDRVAVMYLGRIVEAGPTEEIFARPLHPYTRALLASVPRVDAPLASPPLKGDEPPSPLRLPTGCRFHPRCQVAEPRCSTVVPVQVQRGPVSVECHLVAESELGLP